MRKIVITYNLAHQKFFLCVQIIINSDIIFSVLAYKNDEI